MLHLPASTLRRSNASCRRLGSVRSPMLARSGRVSGSRSCGVPSSSSSSVRLSHSSRGSSHKPAIRSSHRSDVLMPQGATFSCRLRSHCSAASGKLPTGSPAEPPGDTCITCAGAQLHVSVQAPCKATGQS